jgi:hypothetical protein
MPEEMADTLRSSFESLQVIARTLQEAAERSVETVSELARHSTGQAMRSFSLADEELYELTTEASHNVRVVSETSATLTRAFEDVSREWIRLSQRRLQQNIDAFNALARCRSTTEFLAIQNCLVLNDLERSIETTRSLAEIAIRMSDEAARTITVQAESTTVQMEEPPQKEKTDRRINRAA